MGRENENSKWLWLLLLIIVALVVLVLRLRHEFLKLSRQVKKIEGLRRNHV
jgi:hypothetical protein